MDLQITRQYCGQLPQFFADLRNSGLGLANSSEVCVMQLSGCSDGLRECELTVAGQRQTTNLRSIRRRIPYWDYHQYRYLGVTVEYTLPDRL